MGGSGVSSSWFAGQVAGDNAVGGLAGILLFARLEDSWAAVDIDAPIGAGELAGRVGGNAFLSRLWGEGFSPTSASQNDDVRSIYYDNIRSLEDADLGGAWAVGTDDDFPVLADRLRGLQGAAVAFGLTRVAGVYDDANAPLPLDFSDLALPLDFAVMRLTPNTDEIDAFVCEFADGALRAATGYNGATVMMTVIADDWRLASRGGCDVGWVGSSAQGVMTLRLVSAAGAGAEEARLTTDYRIDIAETLARMALDRFIKEISADGFNWFQPVSDWDGDEVLNPYDWTPTSVTVLGMTVGVNLTLGGANGEADSPWPIYNVWQLQAIDGISVSSEGKIGGENELFGSEDRDRLGAHYRLALDIDAAPTRNWGAGKEGFNPIGGDLDFAGGFDGGGYAVRGLFINRSRTSDVGLFSGIDSLHEITNLGVEEADILGGTRVGILAGHLLSDVGKIWTTGKVVGNVQVNFGDNIGGLAGTGAANAHDSWSTADVRGGTNIGGLIGRVSGEETVILSDNWAAGDVVAARTVDTVYVGGFGGIVAGGDLVLASFARNWSAGAVAGGAFANGFLGGVFNDSSNTGAASVSLSYWNADTSGVADLPAPAAVYGESVLLQTLGAADFGDDDSWDVGGGGDFPLLADLSRPWQAVNLARALTRILILGDGTRATADERSVARSDLRSALRLDTNGLAADEGADGTSIPICSFADGVLRAETNYNGVTMELRLLAEEAALIAAAGDCEANIESVVDEFAATLRLEIAAPAIGGDRARRLTTDYPLAVAPSFESPARAVFLAEIASGERRWLGGDSDDWDRDGVLNPYDWTPASVAILGVDIGVNLTLGGANGTAGSPWPIYNIWQLQAIDGKSVSIDGVMAGGDGNADEITLFGDSDSERLNENYRLAVDIDATPTRDWDGGRGFDPIGASLTHSFVGVFDGDGRVVRGLRINRPSEDFVGLFASATGDNLTSARVIDLGLDDARIAGGDNVGAIAGSWADRSDLLSVWARGRVTGKEAVGGLVGGNVRGSGVYSSWFAGQVAGDNAVGGLAGFLLFAGLEDSWAAVDIDAPIGAGELAGRVDAGSSSRLLRLWGESSLPAGSSQNDGTRSIYYDNIRSLADASFGDKWDVGTGADFPVLVGHSRGLQGAAVASGLTRVVGIDGGANVPLTPGFSERTLPLDFAVMRLTANTDEVDALACEFADGALRAATGYNGATVMMTVIADDWRLASRGGCDVGWVGSSAQGVMTLRLLFSAGAGAEEAKLTTDYRIDIAETLARMALDRFIKEISADGFNWFQPVSDWDGDEVLNPYDWTPTSVTVLGMTVGVNLTLGGANGEADSPWPIYNVWQLQAIDGISVSSEGEIGGENELFGSKDRDRLGAHYRLALDIDASPTRGWDNEEGFNPIGGTFAGGFDGGGYAVRGLFINRFDTSFVGLFNTINSMHEITNLGVEEADILGNDAVGILAGYLWSDVSRIWTTGKVVGSGNAVGGLIGFSIDANVHDSWSTADVRGALGIGGLIGQITGAGTVTLSDSWAAGDVNGLDSVGGFGGLVSEFVVPPFAASFARNWSAGAVAGDSSVGGFLGAVSNAAMASVSLSYWNADTSGIADSDSPYGASVLLQTLDAADFGDDDSWDVGESDDFPLLTALDRSRQAVYLTRALTRLLILRDGTTAAADGRITMRLDAPLTLRLDTNGLAANDPGGADSTPTPSCIEDGEGVRAETNYNNVTVWLRAAGGGRLTLSPSSNCVVEFTYPLSAQDRTAPISLLLSITSAESSLSRSHPVVASPFSARLPTRVFAPFDAMGETALLTVSLAFGALTPFTAALRNNASVVVESARDTVLLLRAPSATALFARDNESFIVTLRAFEESTDFSETLAIELKSSPRPFNEPMTEFELPYEQATVGARIFGDAGLSIWHNEDPDIYSLEQAGSNFGVSSSLPVTLAASLALGIYDLTLRLEGGGVTASRPLRLIVSDPAAVLEEFLARIRAGDVVWRGDGDTDDWDGDGIDNPYDWIPAKVKDLPAPLPDSFDSNPWYQETRINLTLFGSNPRPIYNVWQLQAIDGVSVSADGAVRGNFGFFGGSEGARLDGQYRLALDIDATPTRNWKGTNEGGFRPIGGARPANHRSQSFSGSLDGAGYEIRGLSVSVARDRHAGVFSDIHTNGSVASLHFADLFVSGGGDDNDYVGGLAGSSYGNVSLVGISGRVVRSGNGPAGGLVGVSAGGRIDETWFAGEVEAEDGVGGENGMGGLIGHSGFSNEAAGGANMNNNWAHARVEEKDDGDNLGWVGGLIGGAFAGIFENGWTGGEVVGDRPGGFIGRLDSEFADTNDPTASPPTEFSRGYFDSSTSTATKTVGFVSGDDLVEVFAVDTMVTVSVSRWSNVVWNFGATISDGPADYPFLRRYEAMRPGAQAVAYAARQIRLLAGGLEVKRGEAFVLGAGDVLTLDTNGLAVDHAPSPSCAPGSNSGEVQAATNYNGVTVILRATNGVSLSLSAAGDCVVEHSGEGEAFSILAAVSAGETAQTLSFSFTSAAPSRFFPQPLLSTATANVDDAARLAIDICRGHRGGQGGLANHRSLRLDADFGHRRRRGDRGQFDFGRRGRIGGESVADLQYLAIAGDCERQRFERRSDDDDGLATFRRRRQYDGALSIDERHRRDADARLDERR